MARKTGGDAQRGPLYRHRRRHLPGAQRIQHHRVLDVEFGTRRGMDQFTGRGVSQDRSDRQGLRDPALAILG